MEALIFYIVLAGLCTADVIAMVKQGFRERAFPISCSDGYGRRRWPVSFQAWGVQQYCATL